MNAETPTKTPTKARKLAKKPHSLCEIKHEADKLAIYVLIRKVKEAVAEYDKTNDHLKHDANGDCIRCRLVKALGPLGAS